MNLIELIEIWRLDNDDKSNVDFLTQIFNEADLDERIDRHTLALEIISECGTQTPRYMNTGVFAVFAINFFKVHAREYTRDLDALDLKYAAIADYDITKTYDRTTNLVGGTDRERTRTDDLTETIENGDTTFTHSVSADNESGYTGRSQDVTHDMPRTRDNEGTQKVVENVDTTRDFSDMGAASESGRKRPAQELLFSEFEANRLNIYRNIALDFSDTMMLSVC